MAQKALFGARIFDGNDFHDDCALIVAGNWIGGIVPVADMPVDAEPVALGDGVLAPGFIDAQINGGGGRMLNDDPSPETMFAILSAHRPYGTTTIMPTLITDETSVRNRALESKDDAVRADRGVAGLHLEGPHLAPARKGVHRAELMRPMSEDDIGTYVAAAGGAGRLMITVAAEQVTPDQVKILTEAGVIVSIGHSDTDADTALCLFEAGARGVTHLFNAMSGLGSRAPGLVGAALDCPEVWAGIIADGFHIDPRTLRIALRAKGTRGQGRLFFVTDAMSLVGQEADEFILGGRTVRRERTGFCPRLTLKDGTLAGSDLDMASAVRFGVTHLDLPLDEALRMAAAYPADFLRLSDRGRLLPGLRADIVHLDNDLFVRETWRGGQRAEVRP
jgi:N-acetylglucosamine-6-phosphate deacetylase